MSALAIVVAKLKATAAVTTLVPKARIVAGQVPQNA